MIVVPPLTSSDEDIDKWVAKTLAQSTQAPYARQIKPAPGVVPPVQSDTRIELGNGTYILPDLRGLKHVGIYGQPGTKVLGTRDTPAFRLDKNTQMLAVRHVSVDSPIDNGMPQGGFGRLQGTDLSFSEIDFLNLDMGILADDCDRVLLDRLTARNPRSVINQIFMALNARHTCLTNSDFSGCRNQSVVRCTTGGANTVGWTDSILHRVTLANPVGISAISMRYGARLLLSRLTGNNTEIAFPPGGAEAGTVGTPITDVEIRDARMTNALIHIGPLARRFAITRGISRNTTNENIQVEGGGLIKPPTGVVTIVNFEGHGNNSCVKLWKSTSADIVARGNNYYTLRVRTPFAKNEKQQVVDLGPTNICHMAY